MFDVHLDFICVSWDPFDDSPWIHPTYLGQLKHWKAKCWIISLVASKVLGVFCPQRFIATSIWKIFHSLLFFIETSVGMTIMLSTKLPQHLPILLDTFQDITKAVLHLHFLKLFISPISTLLLPHQFPFYNWWLFVWRIKYVFTSFVELVEMN